MINKVNHANGITLPDGRHFEARVGATRWFTARQAERGIAEVREIVDRAVELAQRMFGSDAEAAFDAMIEIATKYGINIQAATMIRGWWNDFAELAVLGLKGEEEKGAEAAEWQAKIEKKEKKNASFREETAIAIAMTIVENSKAWKFWSKNGWFAEAELPEVEEQVAEVEVENNEVENEQVEVEEVAEAEQVENEQAAEVESNEAEEVKAEVAEVEEEVSTGRLIGRMFDASKPERAFAAMVKIVSGGFNVQRVLGFSFSKMNVGGKVINTNQVAYEVMNKNVTPEFRNAAVAAWKSHLDNSERLHRYAADTAEALGVEVEAEPEEVEAIEKDEMANENNEKEDKTVNQERLSDECVANVGGCRVQANTPEDMVRIDRGLRCLRAVLREEETLDGFLEMAGRHGNIVSSESFLARAESVKEGRQRFFLRAKTEDLSSFLLAESGKEATIRRNGKYTWSARKDGAVLEVWVQGEKGVLWWRNTLRE